MLEALLELSTELEQQDPDLFLYYLATTHFRMFYSGNRNEQVPNPEHRHFFGPGERALSFMDRFINGPESNSQDAPEDPDQDRSREPQNDD
jgi:hypothetical protein